MDSSNSNGGSQRLLDLAQRLRLDKPPPFPEDILDQIMEEKGDKVVSEVSYTESATPIAQNTEKIRYKRAAVLICIFEGDAGDLRVILTKRSSKLSTYSGQVALPGGKAEEGDKDDGDTAKREAMEEIGLDPELVDVVTVLEPFFSKYLMRVIPVIGILHDKKAFKPVLNPAEVEAVFDAPLEMFLKDEKRSQKKMQCMGENYLIHLFDYEIEHKKFLIWGLTAGILIRAASVVYQRPPAFMEQNPKFKLPGDLTIAAVLICVFEGADGNLRVFLTQRASSLSTHSGEVALPGGKREEGDADDVQTALREAKEEIGLDPSLVSVITLLPPFHTKYGVTIIPVVGVLFDKDAFSPVLNSAEVEAIFDVPLEMFLKNDNRRAEEREWMGEKHLVHYFDYEDGNKKYVIWAITAAILIRSATLLLQRPPAFLEQRPKIWGGMTENDI
ncbi:Nudix hydrolase 15, mitochondrial [Glycine soja]|uniref:Nudix hydrolase 15, mitochondrial n=1 Tax=Glycine soja TaxID=3848 RepID=A0A0B2QFK3_GLYSO|nr:Nudix hydrolase 15, mitochondrial [Glycine soja]